MNDFWNERYSNKEYAYGIRPNAFFKNSIKNIIPGKILLPAEGEGRNAVYASKLGWDVTAFDSSINAKKKAEALALAENTSFNYVVSNFNDFLADKEYFNCITLIFVPLPKLMRKPAHKKLLAFLKPGGKIILEGFSKNQINNNTGGPKNLEMLFSKEELIQDFESVSEIKITEADTILSEGLFHNGKASTIQMIALK